MFDDTRGQTIIDYSVGVGVFLLSVIFVLFFIQPLLTPFIGGQADVIRSDRAADRLTEDMWLTEKDPEPYILDERCTLFFFEQMTPGTPTAFYPEDCQYAQSLTDLNTALGLESTKNINITIENSDPSGGIVTMQNEVGTNVQLAIGDEPPTQGDVTVSQRHAYINGDEYRVYVRIWGKSLGNN
jgi:hypothetical protein